MRPEPTSIATMPPKARNGTERDRRLAAAGDALAGDDDDADEHAGQQRDEQRGSDRGTEEQAEDAGELHVAHAHAAGGGERGEQEEPAGGGARDEPLGLPAGVEREADDDRGDGRGTGELVRDDPVLEVDERHRDQERDEDEPEDHLRGVVVVDGDGDRGQRRGAGLDERVAGGDAGAAAAAAAAQQQPGEQRDVVPRLHRVLAAHAVRAPGDEGHAARHAECHDVEERADEEACEGCEQDGHGGHETGICSVRLARAHAGCTGFMNRGGERRARRWSYW